MAARKASLLLSIMLFLFFLRVVGQIVVALWAPDFLPPMAAWYSGLMPYQYLFPSQIIILALFTKIVLDLYLGHGYWFEPKPRLGIGLMIFGTIYFLAMIIRFIIQGISIPVVFHWVLASFILILGYYHKSQPLRN